MPFNDPFVSQNSAKAPHPPSLNRDGPGQRSRFQKSGFERIALCEYINGTAQRFCQSLHRRRDTFGNFNNILLGIFAYAELARDLEPANSETSSHLDDIMTIAHRGRDLVGRILNFARKKDPVRRPIGWEAIIYDSIRLMRVSLPANVSVHVQPGADVPDVWADLTEFQQRFINLLTNAIHASSPKGGIIEVRLDTRQFDSDVVAPQTNKRNARCVCLSVIDEGEGMNAKPRTV